MGLAIQRLDVSWYVIPTEMPESDGTLEWDATTLVVVEATAGGVTGLGYTYADEATARLVKERLAGVVVGRDPLGVPGAFAAMVASIRNLGRPGIASMAISAVDAALWDLKARLLGVSLAALLGQARASVPVYGSGGFCSYTAAELDERLAGWVAGGLTMVKMKVGRQPEEDDARVAGARRAIGDQARLFVDANGAYTRKQALAHAEAFAAAGVSWFEEPLPSDDLEGLRLLRDRLPMDVTAGEYGYDPVYFRRMLEAGAVDVLMADASRCGGITGFLGVAALCEAAGVPLSSHCAPMLHLALGCAARPLVHLEWFWDHVRIEEMLFDGAISPVDGKLTPDLTRPGLGIELKRQDAAQYAA